MSLTLDVTNLRDSYDGELLKAFYDQMMVPNFGQFEDELEDLSIWIGLLDPEQRKANAAKGEIEEFQLHVIVLIDNTGITSEEEAKGKSRSNRIAGGVACEYYPKSNCGLMTYIAVDPNKRKHGVGRILVENVLKTLNGAAAQAGKGKCHAVFLETNSDNVDASKDVMIPAERRKVLRRLGFRVLNCTYVQPALSPDQEKCTDLLLAVHESFLQSNCEPLREIGTPQRGNSVSQDDKPATPLAVAAAAAAAALSERPISPLKTRFGLPSEYILSFLQEFFTVLMGEESLKSDPDFLSIQQELCSEKFVSVESD